MKKFFAVFALLALALVGCDPTDTPNTPNNPTVDTNIVGEWKLVEWNGETPTFVVYLDFNGDASFSIYQQVWTLYYELFEGSYGVNDDVISGTYTDGSTWASGYKYSIAGNTLTLTSKDNASISSVYEKCTIPQEVIDEATTTRSGEVLPIL